MVLPTQIPTSKPSFLKYSMFSLSISVFSESEAVRKTRSTLAFLQRDTKIGLIAGLGIPLAIIFAVILYFSISGGVAKQQGKISAGNCSDYVDKNYEVVVMQFEELGFDNIVTIDLDDAGLFWNEDGTVESVSIAGNSSFESIHYFHPTDKVIISYH